MKRNCMMHHVSNNHFIVSFFLSSSRLYGLYIHGHVLFLGYFELSQCYRLCSFVVLELLTQHVDIIICCVICSEQRGSVEYWLNVVFCMMFFLLIPSKSQANHGHHIVASIYEVLYHSIYWFIGLNQHCLHFDCWLAHPPLKLGHWGRDKIDAISQTIFSNPFSWMKMHEFRLRFHWSFFVPTVRIDNIPALFQIMAWRRPGDKPLSEPMMVSILTHICVTRPQWVNE